METEACEVLYRFFRTASEYIEGYRSDAPYPESFVYAAAPAAAAVNAETAAAGASAAVHPAGIGD